MTNWYPFPFTAPDDRPIIVAGIWRPYNNMPGGQLQQLIVQWGSPYSDGDPAKYNWIVVGTTGRNLDAYNVDWQLWTELPELTRDNFELTLVVDKDGI